MCAQRQNLRAAQGVNHEGSHMRRQRAWTSGSSMKLARPGA